MHHNLKIWPANFESIVDGRRTAELRIDDRGYAAGDTLTLAVFDPATGKYDGRGCTVMVSHVFPFRQIEPDLRNRLGLNPSFGKLLDLVMLSIELLPP